MERVYLLRMGEWEDFNKNFKGVHSHSYEKEEDPTFRRAPHAMALCEGVIFLSYKVES